MHVPQIQGRATSSQQPKQSSIIRTVERNTRVVFIYA